MPDDETWIRSELLCRRFLTNVGERLLMNMWFKMMQRAIRLQKKLIEAKWGGKDNVSREKGANT